ncbi:thrombospondin type 3 repeat-containing protein, partial [Myxococcota bacterium]|nr:thrombospondin type 3 repeat-containing protein [Myxococcota bacterium]
MLDATTLRVGFAEFTSAPIGSRFEMPTVYVNSKENADADGDELSDLGELVMGTDPNKADSDGDGVRDGAEVQSGGDPLSGIAVRTGVMAAASTPGPAVDVSAANDLAAVACKDYGLVLFNVFNGLDPVRIGQVETPGEALRVASS